MSNNVYLFLLFPLTDAVVFINAKTLAKSINDDTKLIIFLVSPYQHQYKISVDCGCKALEKSYFSIRDINQDVIFVIMHQDYHYLATWHKNKYASLKIKNRRRHAVCGGTFDHLHVGHRLLLSVAMMVTKQKLTIGLTAKTMLKNKKYPQMLQNYDLRELILKNKIESFLNPKIKLEIIPILDSLGPTTKDASMELLVASQETYESAEIINQIRQQNGINKLEIITVNLILSENSEKISNHKKKAKFMLRYILT